MWKNLILFPILIACSSAIKQYDDHLIFTKEKSINSTTLHVYQDYKYKDLNTSVNAAVVSKLEAYKDCKKQKRFLKVIDDQYITNPNTKTYGSKLKYTCVTKQINFEGWPEKTWCKDPDLTKRSQDICKEILKL